MGLVGSQRGLAGWMASLQGFVGLVDFQQGLSWAGCWVFLRVCVEGLF